MIFLRQSTASQEVLLGPFLDDTDGKTAETALTINNTDIKLWVRGGTTEANKNSGGATHIASGRYYAVLDATDTATVGELVVNVHVSGALPVRLVCCVLEEAVFDDLFAASAGGYLKPTTAGRTLDVTATGEAGIDWANVGTPGATVALSATTIKTATDVETDTADIQSRLPAALVGGRIDANMGAISSDATAADNLEAMLDGTGSVTLTANITGNITGNLSGSVGSVSGAVGSISGVTFPTNFSALAITAGGIVDADLETIKGQTVTCAAGVTVGVYVGGTGAAALEATAQSILTDTAEIGAAGAGLTALGDTRLANLDAAVSSRSSHSAADVVTALGTGATLTALAPAATALSTATWTNSRAGYLDGLTQLEANDQTILIRLTAIDDYIDTEIAAILEDTGTTLPAQIAALNNLDAAGVRAAVGLASANLDTQLADVPTNAELATALGTADDAVLAAIAALNNLSSAQAQTAAAAALTAYDPPTNAEMEARTLVAANYATAAALTTIDDFLDTEIAAILEDTGTTLPAQIAALDVGGGTGARSVTITITDGTDPLENVNVRVTQGIESYVQTTNASGVATFSLDDATWTVRATKAGYTMSNQSLVVNGTETVTYSMSAVALAQPANPALVSHNVLCTGIDGQPESGAIVYYRMTAGTGTAGYSRDSADQSATANGSGYATLTFVVGATYSIRRGFDGAAVSYVASATAPPETLGSP